MSVPTLFGPPQQSNREGFADVHITPSLLGALAAYEGFNRMIGTVIFAAAFSVGEAFAQAPAIDGEMKKIEQGAGKITIKHG